MGANYHLDDARMIGQVIAVVLALSVLERIGEYTVNLRENVIYQVTGEDVRPAAAHRETHVKDS